MKTLAHDIAREIYIMDHGPKAKTDTREERIANWDRLVSGFEYWQKVQSIIEVKLEEHERKLDAEDRRWHHENCE